MSTREELVGWLKELGLARQDLPYEMVRVFSDDELPELRKSINQSFDNVERVLTFNSLLKHETDEPDDIWHYLLAILDSHSYYACLAIPLIRQLLEPNVNFIYAKTKSEYRINWDALDLIPTPNSILKLPDWKKKIATDAWVLANHMEVLNRRYIQLTSSTELVEWCKYFLEECANLILITTRLALLAKE